MARKILKLSTATTTVTVDGGDLEQERDPLEITKASMMRKKAHGTLSARDTQCQLGSLSADKQKDFSFSREMGVEAHSCNMAMVVTALGQGLTHATTFPIGNIEELDRIFDEEFDFGLEDQLLVYRHGGEWKVYGQREGEFCGMQDELSDLWQTFNKI